MFLPSGNKKSLTIGFFMGLGILVTNLEHEDRFHCKVSSKIDYKFNTKLHNISCIHISVDIVKSIC